MRRIAILAEGHFHWQGAKTAVGMIRYGQDQVVAVLDSTKAGQDAGQVLGNGVGAGIPIVRDVAEALTYQPDTPLDRHRPDWGSAAGPLASAGHAGPQCWPAYHQWPARVSG